MTTQATQKKRLLDELPTNQRAALQSLLTSASTAEAASVAGVKRQTIYKWMKQDNFREALKEAESEALASVSRALVALGERATEALADGLDADADLRLRVRSADIVLGRLLQLRDLVDIEERLTRIESQVNHAN